MIRVQKLNTFKGRKCFNKLTNLEYRTTVVFSSCFTDAISLKHRNAAFYIVILLSLACAWVWRAPYRPSL